MRRSRKWNATLDTAQRGEVKHVLQQVFDPPPSRRTLEVALLYLIRRDKPSSEEGITIHYYSS
jgi:hypothetical protein